MAKATKQTEQPSKRRGRKSSLMTDERVQAIHKEWKAGSSYTVLAAKYNIAKSTISEAFRRHNLREERISKYSPALIQKVHKFWLECKSYKKTSEKFGIPRPVLWTSFRKYGLSTAITPRETPKRRYTREETVKFHEYWKNYGYKKTSEKFDVPHQSLWSLFQRFDLVTTRRTPKKK